jgi:hypothetical protein
LKDVCKSKNALLVLKLVHLLIESFIFLKSLRLDEYTTCSKVSSLSLIPTAYSNVSIIFLSSLSEYDFKYGSKTSDIQPLNLIRGGAGFGIKGFYYKLFYFFFFI